MFGGSKQYDPIGGTELFIVYSKLDNFIIPLPPKVKYEERAETRDMYYPSVAN